MYRLIGLTVCCMLIFFGITGLYMIPKLIQERVEAKFQLKINTKMYSRFTDVPIALTVKFYLFNITNSERVLAGLERPQFQEVGPFMYKEWRRRMVLGFPEDSAKIRYREYKKFIPMYPPSADDIATGLAPPEMIDPKSANVTIVNVPLLGVLTKLANIEEGSLKRALVAKIASRLIETGQDKILITRPANELLFDGYKVQFLESARLLFESLGYNFDVSPLPNNKFGFFYLKNNTWSRKESGELVVYTGMNGSSKKYMLVDSWNDQKKLNVWYNDTDAGDKCNRIQGSDGSQFSPGLTKTSRLHLFSPLICTSIYLNFQKETSARDIPLFRFTTPPEVFAAPRKNPRSACYCTIRSPAQTQRAAIATNGVGGYSSTASLLAEQQVAFSQPAQAINDSRCYIDGLIDLSLCQRGAPIAASGAHFYQADPMLAIVSGLKPNKELHETYLDVEPITGSVMRAASRAQINGYVEAAALDVIDNNIIGNMTAMVAPLMWLEEKAEIDGPSSDEFKTKLLNRVQKMNRVCVYFIIVGIIGVILLGLEYWCRVCRSDGRPITTGRKRRGYLGDNLRLGGNAKKSNRYYRNELQPKLLSKSDSTCSSQGIVSASHLALSNAEGVVPAESPVYLIDNSETSDDENEMQPHGSELNTEPMTALNEMSPDNKKTEALQQHGSKQHTDV